MNPPGAGPAPEEVVRIRMRVVRSCLDCVAELPRVLRSIPGVRALEVLGGTGIVIVEHDPDVTAETLRHAAAHRGLDLVEDNAGEGLAGRPWWRRAELGALAAAGLLLVGGLVTEISLGLRTAAALIFLAAAVVGGVFPLRHAIEILRQRRLTVGTLLVVAAVGALALGPVEEAAILVVVFSFGEVMEEYAADRARGSIRALMALRPKAALRKGAEGSLPALVAVEALSPGEVRWCRSYANWGSDA